MNAGAIVGIVFGVIALVVIGTVMWFVGIYNTLVGLRNQVKNAWANIDVQLKRRHDLIPNIVETVKGYASHERETLENVIKARSMAVNAVGKGVGEQAKAESNFSQAISRLLVVCEQYPNLKANEVFMDLQGQLKDTEDKISLSRQYYNDQVLQYNNSIQMFPSNIVAGMFHFTIADFFKTETPEDREVPKVSFAKPSPAQNN